MSIQRKSVLAEFKARSTPGEFDALFSAFGNIDRDSDRIHKGAFEPAFLKDSKPPVVWTHRWDIPPIGETLDATETDAGAKATARLFLKEHPVAQQVWAGLESGAIKQFSFAFDIAEQSFTAPGDGESSKRHDGQIREITKIGEVFEWGPTLVGSNPATGVLSKSALASMFGLTEEMVESLTVKEADPPTDPPGDQGDPGDENDAPDPAAVTSLLAERPRLHLHS